MDPNALVFQFGAISSATIGLVFLYKWAIDGRHDYDLYWGVSQLAFSATVTFAAFHYAFRNMPFGMLDVLGFWIFVVFSMLANFAFRRDLRGMRLLLLACAAGAFLSFALGFYRIEIGLIVFAPIAAAITVWTGWILRNLPRVGRVAFALFALRGIITLARPYVANSPYLFQYSTVTFTLAFFCGAILLTGSLLRSRESLVASQERLAQINATLIDHENELNQSNRLLEEQAVRLERLSADYASALRRAEQANRAKDSFISNMNHEFRTPLNAVLGFSELIRAEAERAGHARLAEYSGYAYDGGKAMLRNVDRILDFVTLDAGERDISKVPFDPRAAIRAEIDALTEIAVAKRLQIAELLDDAPQVWPGDERAFRSIVDELLRNALKAAPDASTVTVQVSRADLGLSLQIADYGPGLSDAFLKTIGERFNIREDILQRGGQVQGVGLGLCIAGRYAQLMGGTLSFDRNQPKGTIVRLILSAA